jgi:outer membrane protein TolC
VGLSPYPVSIDYFFAAALKSVRGLLESVMFGMQESIRSCRRAALCALIAAASNPVIATASALSLDVAEELALAADPGIQAVEASRTALEELAVAADQLPDPMVKLGMVGLPTDTFHLGQEAMTQVQVGVVQKFPRGKSRALRSRQIGERSQGLTEAVSDQQLRTLLAVREQFLEVLKQQELARINSAAVEVLADVARITEDYYATGRVHQKDVLQAAVELARFRDRATRIAQSEDQARTRLSTWIGNAAYGDLDAGWPRFLTDPSATQIRDTLPSHPRIRALQSQVTAAETGVELARQKYKPEFAVDLTYGGRGGTHPDGSARADLLSLMVMMDVPLFTKNRQDRLVSARIAESSAALYTRDDVYRRMSSEIEYHMATYRKQRERIDLFEDTLLPEAAFSSEASFGAYQSSVADLTTLLRTQITEFDLQLEHARLQAEILKTEARLRYLEGA